ncbi:MAG: energy-coupling factor transporter transmembrane protein EcfT [Synechococcaceae cyanobacterium SM2_3_2]|nr:energy-coupling factor transporter transmembrane protein EcfT [Synechococcaceae cyanobacterium SM2_3_2]
MDLLRNVPMGIYLESPRTWLHTLDPRIKLVWLLSFLLSPILASDTWRLGLVVGLLGVTLLSGLPWRVWRRQMPLVLLVGLVSFLLTALAPDGLGVTPIPQRMGADSPAYGLLLSAPGASDENTVEDLEQPDSASADLLGVDWGALQQQDPYRYQVLRIPRLLILGPFTITQRSLNLGIRVGTLIFLLLYATSLFLLTTAPEEVSEGIERMMRPLNRLGVPVSEIILTLTLALRFLPLVLEEVQNLIRAVRTRDIRWQLLSVRGSIHAILSLVERLLENLLLRAEQTASAMKARGYSGPSYTVRWHIFTFRSRDWLLIGLLPLFWGIRLVYFNQWT